MRPLDLEILSYWVFSLRIESWGKRGWVCRLGVMKSYRCISSVKLRAWKGLQNFFPLNWEFGKKNGLPVPGCGWKLIVLEKSKLILCGDRGLNSHIKLGKRILSQEIIVKTGWEIHGSGTGRHKIAHNNDLTTLNHNTCSKTIQPENRIEV